MKELNGKVKLRSNGVLLGLILVTVTIVALVFFYFYCLNDYEHKRREEQLNELAIRQAGYVDTYFDSQKLLLKSVAYILQDYNIADARVHINKLVDDVPMDYLWIADSEGNMPEEGEMRNVSGHSYFQQSMRGETVVTDIVQSLRADPLVIVSTPIYHLGAGETTKSTVPVAVLFGAFKSATLTDILQNSTFDGSGLMFLVNAHNEFVTEPGEEVQLAFREFCLKNPNYIDHHIYDLNFSGSKYCFNAAMAKTSDWVVCSITTEQGASDLLSIQSWPFLFMLPLVVLISIVFICILYVMRKNFIQLRLHDEKFHLAIGQLSSLLFEYDIASDTVEFLETSAGIVSGYKNMKIKNPDSFSAFWEGCTEESRSANREMISKIKNGAQNASCVVEIALGKDISKYFNVAMSSVKNKNGMPYYALGIINDITKKMEQEKALNDKINYDILTGLLNRNSLEAAVSKTLRDCENMGKTHAFLVCDIDNFKQINDTYGHLTGDVLLQKISNVLSYIFGKNDFVSRFGGDEFVIFLSDIASAKVAISKAKTICEELENLTVSDDIHEKFAMSVGISFSPKDGSMFGDLYRKADEALYRAKHHKGNSYAVYDSFNESDNGKVRSTKQEDNAFSDAECLLDAELDLFYREVQIKVNDSRPEVMKILQSALNNKEIELYIQPKFDAKSRVVHSAEVLARWNSPGYGLLSPNRFIPLYERTDMIDMFDLYMLKGSCRLLKEWKGKGRKMLPLSVNQAPSLILMRGYIDILKKEIEENGIDPSYICIEITERAIFSSYRTITKVVQSLKEIGVLVSLDDFGSGYTSLNMLKNLYIGELKIDKQFIDRLSFQKQRAHVIVKHIISLAQEMGIQTTMEGVETEEQADFITSVGCDTLQGYLFAKPMPSDKFEYIYLDKEKN